LFTKSKHLDHPVGGGGGDFSENFERKIYFWGDPKGLDVVFTKRFLFFFYSKPLYKTIRSALLIQVRVLQSPKNINVLNVYAVNN